tara:strand:+ start:28658 stop:28867 length:210 start_codon:yes stop_codon:yes gene_type:complete
MTCHSKTEKFHEESIVDDEIIVIIEDDEDSKNDTDWVECMDCVQRKMICIISILIIGTILLVFLHTLNM